MLLAGLQSFFDAVPMPTLKFAKYPQEFQILLTTQTTISWGHLLHGRWTTLWSDIQQDHMHRRHRSKKFNPAVWHHKLLNPLLSECHALWTLQNSERHGTAKTIQRQKRLEQLERDLIDLYKYKTKVLASDCDLFDRPIANLLTVPLNESSKWMNHANQLSYSAVERLTVATSRMYAYYQPTSIHSPREHGNENPKIAVPLLLLSPLAQSLR
jgi:hypothetical protein